tara:strand:+ start:135 stop:356 length:222 start_codon:yes stop_codon:yes gene_type:complete
MAKQTSIEWLVKELNQAIDYIPMNKWDAIANIIQQAKQMEKEQINKAYYDGYYEELLYDARRYYEDTYGEGNK